MYGTARQTGSGIFLFWADLPPEQPASLRSGTRFPSGKTTELLVKELAKYKQF